MRRNRGPQARLLGGVEEFSSLCLRLPHLVTRVDALLQRVEENAAGHANKEQFWSVLSSSRHRYRIAFFITSIIILSAASFISGYLLGIL